MSLSSAYRQGFLRFAGCTFRTSMADPAANAADVLRPARTGRHDGVICPRREIARFPFVPACARRTR